MTMGQVTWANNLMSRPTPHLIHYVYVLALLRLLAHRPVKRSVRISIALLGLRCTIPIHC